LVAANAFLATSHSAILVRQRERVYIHGTGSVDGNKAQQARTAPLLTENEHGCQEEVLANSGIVVFDSSFVRVKGLRVHHANMHNVTLYESENCEVSEVEASACCDKNLLVLNTIRSKLLRNYCHDSVCEDGICLYFNSHFPLIAGNTLAPNARYKLWVHPICKCVTILGKDALAAGQP
jgi:hypothetical protein